KAAIEFSKVGIMTQYQYEDDFFGSDNSVLMPTLKLLHTQRQGIMQGIKNSANIRFLIQLNEALNPADILQERERFISESLDSKNNGGVMMFDLKYKDVKPIDSKPLIVNTEQMKIIQENVYTYFGTNIKILQNNFSEDDWNAYYESKVEPFALQLSLVMTNMTFTPRQKAVNNGIFFTANRLQYASNQTKLDISSKLLDRGILSINDVRAIWNLPPVEGGDVLAIRKEYTEMSKLGESNE
ncbi:MAG: phage portal protein, partial [Clostridiales bacterium]|nr:phage portal protein [Clostridiales bacterium]